MKGISPVIATILIVMVTVGLVAFSFSWFMGVGESGKETTMTTISQMEKAQQGIEIGTAYQCGSDICFELRASGMNTVPIPINGTSYYINDKPMEMDGWNAEGVGISCTGGAAPDSLVGSWHFSEGTGTTTYDDSGKGNDGTLEDANTSNSDGATPPQWVDGRYGNGLEFDGSDDYVNVSDDINPSSITIETWVYPYSGMNCSNDNNWRYILSKVHGGVSQGSYHLIYEASWPRPQVGFTINVSDTTLRLWIEKGVYPGKWTHLAFTYDESEGKMKTYFNGKLNSYRNITSPACCGFSWGGTVSSPGPISPNSDPVRIAGGINTGCPTGGGYFKGVLDSVKIYNRALSGEEIQNLYNLRLSPGNSCYGKILDYDCEIGDSLRVEHPWGASKTVSINGCN